MAHSRLVRAENGNQNYHTNHQKNNKTSLKQRSLMSFWITYVKFVFRLQSLKRFLIFFFIQLNVIDSLKTINELIKKFQRFQPCLLQSWPGSTVDYMALLKLVNKFGNLSNIKGIKRIK